MEKRFQSLSLFEFQQRFPDDETCMEYLAAIKWPDGFIWRNVGIPNTAKENSNKPDNVPYAAIRPPPQVGRSSIR